jgi:hypothetical protein
MAGLQDIWPIRVGSIVIIAVLHPRRDAAQAASAPAWPPPMMMMSKEGFMD